MKGHFAVLGAIRAGRDNRPVELDLTPQPWMLSGLCGQSDPDAWFPDKGGNVWAAKRICARCPVLAECLAYAVEHHELGVWGGTSERERRKLRHVDQAGALEWSA